MFVRRLNDVRALARVESERGYRGRVHGVHRRQPGALCAQPHSRAGGGASVTVPPAAKPQLFRFEQRGAAVACYRAVMSQTERDKQPQPRDISPTPAQADDAAPGSENAHEGATEAQVGDRTGPGAGSANEPAKVKDRGGVAPS